MLLSIVALLLLGGRPDHHVIPAPAVHCAPFTCPPPLGLPRILPNDNRKPAGTWHQDTLAVRLVVRRADWYPERSDGPFIAVEAFGEEGAAPTIPAPLIRVREGAVIHATVRNALPDSTLYLLGLGEHPVRVGDTLRVAPGETREVTFRAGAPGTYLYRAVIGNNPDDRKSEHEAAGGAFVVDPAGGSPPDRILVMNIYGDRVNPTTYRNALAINGKSWPYTEGLQLTVGDSARWRVVNMTARSHPMHLHGFYFRIDAWGTGLRSEDIPVERRHLAVTENFPKWETRDIAWSPDRPGNWLFHCHLTFHVVATNSRLDAGAHAGHDTHSSDPREHMAGLVLALTVAPRPGASYARSPNPRRLDLFMQEGPARNHIPITLGAVLQRGPVPPAPDSVEVPGSLLLLTRGEATDIAVHNRTRQATAVHWHGIELESWSDGVAGWSGAGKAVAPAIPAGGTFVAHLSLPRAGTFIYHSHLNDIEQVTSGLIGPIVVLEPGEAFDPARDHVYLASWDGPATEAGEIRLLVNGDSTTAVGSELAAGVSHRFRLINIGPANSVRYTLRQDTTAVQWRARAKDGADLPEPDRSMQAASVFVAVGETYDFDWLPPGPGVYELSAGFGVRNPTWHQRIVVR